MNENNLKWVPTLELIDYSYYSLLIQPLSYNAIPSSLRMDEEIGK